MPTLTEVLQHDPDWQKAKMKAENIKSEKILTRIEFLKLVGWQSYSDKAYQEYLRTQNVKS
jgi:hypothetical protein